MLKAKIKEPVEKVILDECEKILEEVGFFYGHIPNVMNQRQKGGGFLSFKANMNPKKLYKNNGVADLIIFAPFKVCLVELKRFSRSKEKNGGLDPDQILFRDYCVIMGYEYIICYSTEEFRKVVERLVARMD